MLNFHNLYFVQHMLTLKKIAEISWNPFRFPHEYALNTGEMVSKINILKFVHGKFLIGTLVIRLSFRPGTAASP